MKWSGFAVKYIVGTSHSYEEWLASLEATDAFGFIVDQRERIGMSYFMYLPCNLVYQT